MIKITESSWGSHFFADESPIWNTSAKKNISMHFVYPIVRWSSYMEVSWNGATPQSSSILVGFSHPQATISLGSFPPSDGNHHVFPWPIYWTHILNPYYSPITMYWPIYYTYWNPPWIPMTHILNHSIYWVTHWPYIYNYTMVIIWIFPIYLEPIYWPSNNHSIFTASRAADPPGAMASHRRAIGEPWRGAWAPQQTRVPLLSPWMKVAKASEPATNEDPEKRLRNGT